MFRYGPGWNLFAYSAQETRPVTEALLSIHGVSAQAAGEDMQIPPTTFYGAVLVGESFTPTAGMTVTAWVNTVRCGRDETRDITGQIVYVVDVFADWPGATGCGAPGRTVNFDVNGQAMSPTAAWDNRQLWKLDLSLAVRVYLLLILKEE